MKKLLFLLLLITAGLQAQTLQNPTYGNTTTNTLKIKAPATVTSVNFLSTNEADGSVSKIAPINVNIPYTPVNYSISNQSIGQHLTGIDTRLGQISSTTAGITQRVYFTADNTTVNSVVYFASSLTGKGSTATGSPPALVLADNTKAFFTKDIISIAQPSATIGYAGTYSGNLTVSATPTPVATQQRFTVEIYRTNNLGIPIASGVSGAPTGDLGVTVLAVLDSGIINLSVGAITNVPVSGILTQNVTINTGERLRYHVSAAKIGTGGGSVTFGVYYGTSYNSYYDVPVAIRTNGVLNDSGVTGVTTTDALNYLDKKEVNPNQFTGTDQQKIQSALNYAVANGINLRIGFNTSTGLYLWNIDSAILLKTNTNIIIDRAIIKLTNTSRDNVFRTENCGFGITNPSANPLNNITITAVNGGAIQGADIPRSTGDSNKTLSLTPTALGPDSFGTDAGVSGQSQTGDWRNIGILMVYTTNIKIQGLKYVNMHAWANSFERCSKISMQDIEFNTPINRTISGSPTFVKNTDGMDFLLGCNDIYVNNITGITGDDSVAFSLVPLANRNPGVYNSMYGSGNFDLGASDNMNNVVANNIKTYSDHASVRLLNVLSKTIKNVQINNIEDLTTVADASNPALIIMGSQNPLYGGSTPLGDLAFINVNNVICRAKSYAIKVEGSLSESTISNVIKESGTFDPIFFLPASLGARDVAVSNIMYKGNYTYESGVFTGSTPVFYGSRKDFSKSFNSQTNFETGTIVSTETNMDNYTVTGFYVTPISGLTNIPSGWTQKRYNILTTGDTNNPYKYQTIIDNVNNIKAYRVSYVTSVWSSWQIVANISSPNFTGTPTAPTATSGTNTTQIATTAFVQAATGVQPLVYTALLTQTGTSAPTAIVLKNTLGGTVVWSRTSTGVYGGTLSSAFTANKTFVSISLNPGAAQSGVNIGIAPISTDTVQISTVLNNLTASDGLMSNNSIEIRVYP